MLDFARLHAVTDGGFLQEDPFAGVLEAADQVVEPGAPFHIHFSDIAVANRNETTHLPYGEGTLRAEPLRDALKRFKRPATVISESPGEESHQAIRQSSPVVRRRSEGEVSCHLMNANGNDPQVVDPRALLRSGEAPEAQPPSRRERHRSGSAHPPRGSTP